MRISALTTLLLAAATSVVAAAPARDAAPPAHESVAPTKVESTERLRYGDDAAKAVEAPAEAVDGWVELASATPASHGREFITVDSDAGALTHLRLTAATGRTTIQSLRVDYVDGAHKVFPLGKTVAKGRPASVDLRGPREVKQIVVVTDRASRGSYVVQGRAGATGVAMR